MFFHCYKKQFWFIDGIEQEILISISLTTVISIIIYSVIIIKYFNPNKTFQTF